jgi:uncharacterized protein YbaP (TraB family)
MLSMHFTLARILIAAVAFCVLPAQANPGANQDQFPLLWSLKGDQNHVYILGSVQLLPYGTRGLPPVVNAAYLTSDLVVFESDLFLIGSVAFETDELTQARYPPGLTIQDEMPADLMAAVSVKVEELGLPMAILERYRPWFFAQTLATAQFAKDGFPLDNGVDISLYRKAVADLKLTTGLTPPLAHLATFAEMDREQNEHFLRITLKDLYDTRAQIARILDIYRNANLELVEQLALEMQADSASLYQRLVGDRNEEWMEKIEEYRKRDTNVLIVVGALHLVGEQGLIERFKRKGWNPNVPKYRGFRPPE